jgi:hypothetical protein
MGLHELGSRHGESTARHDVESSRDGCEAGLRRSGCHAVVYGHCASLWVVYSGFWGLEVYDRLLKSYLVCVVGRKVFVRMCWTVLM